MPGYTCPEIDSIIAQLEVLRSENELLREWADYWKGEFEESERERDDLQMEVQSLQHDLDQLS